MTVDRRDERQAGVRAWLEQQAVEALLVTHLPNIRYLTGFTGSAALLVIGRGDAVLITDFRYAVQAPREVGGTASVVVETASVWPRVASHLSQYGAVAFEATDMTVRDAQRLGEATSASLVPVADVVEPLRAIKDPGELSAIRQAVDLAVAGLAEVAESVASGQTEFAIAGRLEGTLRRLGSAESLRVSPAGSFP